jgi:RecA-family ATPase
MQSATDNYTNTEGVNPFEIGGVKIKQRYLAKILSKPHQDAEVHWRDELATKRHTKWCAVSWMLTGEGYNRDEQFFILRAWIPDDDKPDSELYRIIDGALAINGAKPSGGASGAPLEDDTPQVTPFKFTGRKEPLPEPMQSSTLPFLNSEFQADELVAIATADKYGNPSVVKVKSRAEWETFFQANPSKLTAESGIWYCVNPLDYRTPMELDAARPARQKDGQRLERKSARCEDNVSRFRFGVVELEIDKAHRKYYTPNECRAKLEEFYAAALDSNLPVAAVYTSGEAEVEGGMRAPCSLHVKVCIDAADLAEFKARMKTIHAYLAHYGAKGTGELDTSTVSGAQLSRLPGAMRGDSEQSLYAWKSGPASYREWEDAVGPRIITIEDPMEWTQDDIALPGVTVHDFLHQGHVAMVTGGMKTNKSWTLMQLAISLATGRDWLSKKCEKQRVLYIDTEIQRPFWNQRIGFLLKNEGLHPGDVFATGGIRPVLLAGRVPTASALSAELERLYNRGLLEDFTTVILDPIYQIYEDDWDENSNADMGKLGRILRAITVTLGKSLIFAHHMTKGSQEGKRDIERASGGGAFGRFVQSSLAITLQSETDHKYRLGWTTSFFPPQAAQIAYRNGLEWEISDEDPNAGKAAYTVENIMECLPSYGASSDIWFEKSRDEFPEMTTDAFQTLRAKAKKEEWAKYNKATDKWTATEKWANRSQAEMDLDRKVVQFS